MHPQTCPSKNPFQGFLLQLSVLLALSFSPCVYAAPVSAAFVPQDLGFVLAEGDFSDTRSMQQSPPLASDIEATLFGVNRLIARSEAPGKSYLLDSAVKRLKPWMQATGGKPSAVDALPVQQQLDLRVTWAHLLQARHEFAGAHKQLKTVLSLDSRHGTALLMTARIHLIEGEIAAAKSACLKTLGVTDSLSTAVCLLDVNSQQGKLQHSFDSLSAMLDSFPVQSEQGEWAILTLNDMAMRLKRPKASEHLLQKLATTPGSSQYWIRWADTKLLLAKYEEVESALSKLADASPYLEDALLVRLAIAEQKIGRSRHWQARAKQKIALRELRDDSLHAADIALFYLDVEPTPPRALRWAQINYDSVREPVDLALLERAKAMAGLSRAGTKNIH